MFDLFNSHPTLDESIARRVDAWEKDAGLQLPRVLRDFYATKCSISLGSDKSPWILPGNELWAEFAQVPPPSLDEVLANLVDANSERVHPLFAQWEMMPLPTSNPLIWIEADVMRIWHSFVEIDGSDDPPVWVHCRDSSHTLAGWTPCTVGHGAVDSNCFSSFMYMLVATSYVVDQSPWSFFGPEANWSDWDDGSEFAYDDMSEQVKPYENGLWLRAREPSPAAIEMLRKTFPQGQQWTLTGDLRTYEFLPDEGRIWVTTGSADESTWWIHAWDEERLSELAVMLQKFGTLATTLRADHSEARMVLKSLKGP